MNIKSIEHYITPTRLSTYAHFEEYKENLIFSKSFYIPLAVLEVSLRNSINAYLSDKIGEDWLEDDTFLYQDAKRKRDEAKSKLKYRHEFQTKDKIIAELNFGFWVGLFNKPYEMYLRYGDLKTIFPSLPSRSIQIVTRKDILNKLYTIKTFRNRIFHYEKVVNKAEFNHVEKAIFELLSYFDEQLSAWTKKANDE